MVAPDGQSGGGMGRVKDYIVQHGAGRYAGLRIVPLVTRDDGGFVRSLLLTLRAIALIWAARFTGRLGLVHVNFGDKASAARKGAVVLATRLVGGPALLHLHAVELHHAYARGGRLLRALIRLPFRAATRVAVLGEAWRAWVVVELGVPADRVDVLWNGVPVDAADRRDRASAGEPVRLLFLGNLLERKGVSDLIAAAASLDPALPDWRLAFAGGGDVARYRTLAEKLGVAGRVSFEGWVDQDAARRLLGCADVLVLPSYDEGLPLVILEALGSGAAVVCTPVGSIPEVLTDGDTALFCRPGDRDSLARALDAAIRDRALREDVAAAGRRLYERRFSIDAFLGALFAIYRSFGLEAADRKDRGAAS
ncbi:glycosyltransferase family 4 protein [Prosthecomicrobium sp. N25]|uniref:glycosyltransferase family 4 protein n=1 Tax=Prosthecomicrobium sp. N25 TaxID=3129254 RepID=UPI003077527D